MFKLQTVLFFGCLIFFCLNVKNLKIKKIKIPCKAYQEDCDALWPTHYCCGDYKCIEYRCQEKDAKEVLHWAPRGEKCDPTHFCPEKFECVAHRCQPVPDEKDVEKLKAKIGIVNEEEKKVIE